MRTLTELRHTPASPSLLRKATGQQQAHNNPIQHNAVLQITRSSVERSCSAVRSISQERGAVTGAAVGAVSQPGVGAQGSQGPGGVGQGFMAVLNAKLIGTAASNSAAGGVNASGSPKSLRKQSLVEAQQQSNQKNTKSAAPGFLETLNAKLAQQQQALQSGNSGVSRSASVRRIMGNRVPIVDPLQVRDSLMDQIRRGTPLRKTSGPINDRSAPKIYWVVRQAAIWTRRHALSSFVYERHHYGDIDFPDVYNGGFDLVFNRRICFLEFPTNDCLRSPPEDQILLVSIGHGVNPPDECRPFSTGTRYLPIPRLGIIGGVCSTIFLRCTHRQARRMYPLLRFFFFF